MPLSVRLRLSGMMFLQFMLLPVWLLPLYVDRKAPKEIRAQAQAFLFLCYGIGSLVGIFVNESLIGANMTTTEAGAKIYQWGPVWTIMTVISGVLMVVFAVAFHDKALVECGHGGSVDAAGVVR